MAKRSKKSSGAIDIEVPAGELTIGSGNVYADIGLPAAGLHAAKAELVRGIARVLAERKMTQAAAAELLGLSQPDVSRMLRGQFSRFTIDRLTRLLNLLGFDIELKVKKRRRAVAGVAVSFPSSNDGIRAVRDSAGRFLKMRTVRT